MGADFLSSANGVVVVTSFQLVVTFIILILLVTAKMAFRSTKKFLGNVANDKIAGAETPIVSGFETLPQVQPLFPLNLIGNLPALLPLSKTLQNFAKMSENYGDIFKIILLGKKCTVLNSAPLAQTLLKSSELGHVVKESKIYDVMQPLITNSLLVSKGKFWQGQRKILMRTQNISSLKQCVKMLNRHSAELVNELDRVFQDGQSHPINEQISTSFLKVINEMITGFEVKSSVEFNKYHHNFQTWKECSLRRIFNPLLMLNFFWKLHPMSKKNAKAVDEMLEFAKTRLKEHRNQRRLPAETSDLDFRSVLDELVDAGVDDKQIIEEINGMIFGGHETGASTIHFLCFLMAHNPDIQRECQREVDEIFKDSQEDDQVKISYETAQSGLKYLERCILETMRLFPPVFVFIRDLETPLDIEYKGDTVRLPAGTAAAVFPYMLHRQDKYYEEPEIFNPDRFLPDEQSKRHAYAFLSFSAGPRNCLGMKFAMLEMKIVAAYLLRYFEMETVDKIEDVPLMPFITLTPERDYIFSFKKRTT